MTDWPALIARLEARGIRIREILRVSRITVWKWQQGICKPNGDHAASLIAQETNEQVRDAFEQIEARILAERRRKLLERKRRYRNKNKEKCNEYSRVYRSQNRDRLRESRKRSASPIRTALARERYLRWLNGNHERYREYQRSWEMERKTGALSDSYMRSLIYAQTKMPWPLITAELIQAKREQIKVIRLMKEMKNGSASL